MESGEPFEITDGYTLVFTPEVALLAGNLFAFITARPTPYEVLASLADRIHGGRRAFAVQEASTSTVASAAEPELRWQPRPSAHRPVHRHRRVGVQPRATNARRKNVRFAGRSASLRMK